MGLFDRLKKPEPKEKSQSQHKSLSEADAAILSQDVYKGTPCIPFIPMDALAQSQAIAKFEGVTGYFIARIPALYPDGSIKYLYKEEFMLLTATMGLTSNSVKKGRIDSFFGFEQPMEAAEDAPYLSPAIFYQNNLSLFRMDFQEEIKFFRQSHAPSLEVALIPKNHNLKIKNLCVVNYIEVTQILLDNKEKPTTLIESYERWNTLKLPSSGPELQEIAQFSVNIRQSSSFLLSNGGVILSPMCGL